MVSSVSETRTNNQQKKREDETSVSRSDLFFFGLVFQRKQNLHKMDSLSTPNVTIIAFLFAFTHCSDFITIILFCFGVSLKKKKKSIAKVLREAYAVTSDTAISAKNLPICIGESRKRNACKNAVSVGTVQQTKGRNRDSLRFYAKQVANL